MDRASTINTREKLGTLVRRFIKFMEDQKHTIFQFSNLIQQAYKIFKDYKKAIDIIFYFEGLGILMRVSQQHLILVGIRGMARKLCEYEQIMSPMELYEEIKSDGKLISVKNQMVSGRLMADVFYKLIYHHEVTNKSSIQEMVDSFMNQQKDLNFKNFIPETLNILSALALIDKNQATEIVTYIGPDLKSYNNKSTWKTKQFTQREQVREAQPQTHQDHNQKETKNGPLAVHISYFPQLCYAVLRSGSWQKPIMNTVFIIGRSCKNLFGVNRPKMYQVDLDLPYKSISRQHALIVYNFQVGRWEIRCLSKKNLIKVDSHRFAWGDQNIWLRNKSEIEIGVEKMYFLEATPDHNL